MRNQFWGLREELGEPVECAARAGRVGEVDHQGEGSDDAGGAGVSGLGRYALAHLYAHRAGDQQGPSAVARASAMEPAVAEPGGR